MLFIMKEGKVVGGDIVSLMKIVAMLDHASWFM